MVNFQINTDSYNPGKLGEVSVRLVDDFSRFPRIPMRGLDQDDWERVGYNWYGDGKPGLGMPQAAPQGGFRDRFWEYLNNCVVDLGDESYSKQSDGTIYTYKQQWQQEDLSDVRQQVSDYFRDYYNKPRWRRVLEDWWGDKSQANEIHKKRKLLGYDAARQLLYDYYQIVQQEGKYDSNDKAKYQVINNFFDQLDSDKGIISSAQPSFLADDHLISYVRKRQRLLRKWVPGSGWSPFGSERFVSRFEAETGPRSNQPATKPSLFKKMRTKLQNSYVAQKLGAIKNSDFVQNIGAKLKGWGSKMLGFFKKSNTSGRSTTSTSEQQTPESEQNPQQIEQTARFRTPEDAKALLEEYKTNNNRMFRAPLQRLGITDLPAFPDREFDNVWAELEAASNELQKSTKLSVLSLLEKINDNNRDLDRYFRLLSHPSSDAINQQENHDNHSTRQDRADSTPNNPDDLSSNLDYADNAAPLRRLSVSANPAAFYASGYNLVDNHELNQNPERSRSPQLISH